MTQKHGQTSMWATASRETPARVAVWGLGKAFSSCAGTLLRMRDAGQIRLVCATDAELAAAEAASRWLDALGICAVSPSQLDPSAFDYLVIANKRNAEAIAERARRDCGVAEEQLLDYRALFVAGLEPRVYRRLRESGLSIVSDGAWGSTVCRAFRMPCLSPFQGCVVKKEDYLRLLEDLPSALACAPTFAGQRFDGQGNTYWAFQLEDVGLRLYDGADPNEALALWTHRCTLLNWDNLLVQFSTTDPRQERRFASFERYKRKVCFVPYTTDVACSVRLPLQPQQRLFASAVEGSIEGGLDGLQLVELLLGSKDFGLSDGGSKE